MNRRPITGSAYAYLAMAGQIIDGKTREGVMDCLGCGAELRYSVDGDGTAHLRCADKCYAGEDWTYKPA